jgi:hypothetical protein
MEETLEMLSKLAAERGLALEVRREAAHIAPDGRMFASPEEYHVYKGKELLFASLDANLVEQWLWPQPLVPASPQALVAERGSVYGAPEDNHGATADFFATWVARKYGSGTPLQLFDAEDVVAFNICQKLSRAANALKADNWLDIQGYAQNALDMAGGDDGFGILGQTYTLPLEGEFRV